LKKIRTALTIVELIFVIVILGVLAAIAIPKLSATRDDAKESKLCKNLAICVTDLASRYTAHRSVSLGDSPTCQRSELNGLITLSGNEAVVVSGAPDLCRHLNRTFTFGGSRVSF
jgi:type II secretory pathway pseudopilin PulG